MSPIWPIATNTLRQTFRQRLFLNVAVFGAGMVLLSMVLGNITFGHPDRVVRSIGLSGVAIAIDLIALLVAVSLIHEEIDRKTLFVVLTRPVRRWEYVVGRYLGLLLALLVVVVGLSAVFVAALSALAGEPSASDAVALLGVLPEAAVLGAFGMVLSAFSTPTVSAGIGLGFWAAAATSDDLLRLTARADELTRLLARGIYYALPSLERFNFRGLAVYQQPVSWVDVGASFAYGGAYVVGLIALASLILSRREMV